MDPSLLRFLVDVRGAEASAKQLRDDLITLLIAGHETTGSMLTWATWLLAQVHTRTHAHMHTHAHKHTYTHTHIVVCVCVCVCVRVYMCIYLCMYVCMYVYTHIHTYISTYILFTGSMLTWATCLLAQVCVRV